MMGSCDFPARPGVPAYRELLLKEQQHKFALVVPVINEGQRLVDQLKRLSLAPLDVDIIIADGGSSDGSTNTEVLREYGVSALLTKTGPGGLSAQLRVAIHHCLSKEYCAIITMDGNGKDDPHGVTTISKALQNGYDFVQGSRFIPGGKAINTPLLRYLAIRLIHAPLISIGSRRWFTDTTNGFRGHSRRLLEDPRVAPLRDVFTSYELLAYLPVQASKLGFKTIEVPVSRSYPSKSRPPTKINGFMAHVQLVSVLIKAITNSYDPR